MKLAVCLMACGRDALTIATVDSFLGFNTQLANESVLLSAFDELKPVAESPGYAHASLRGFRCVHGPGERRGLMAGLRALVLAAEASGATHVLWLENDWDTVRPIPEEALGLDCVVRLYGHHKQRDGRRPAGVRSMATGQPLEWRATQKHGWESANAHWGGAPSIARIDSLLLYINRPTMKAMAAAMGDRPTVRPVENFMWHTGIESTPEFMA